MLNRFEILMKQLDNVQADVRKI